MTDDEITALGSDPLDDEREERELTHTEIYQGELEAGVISGDDLRSDETDDANVAAEEGLAYVPPIDPPVVPDPDDPEGIQIAAGFGGAATDEPYDADHHSDALPVEDEMEARVREALRADSATSRYAETLVVGIRDGVVALRGVVDDLDDTDTIMEVVGRVSGVDEVIDQLDVRGVTDGPPAADG
jgi:hypothetical protein